MNKYQKALNALVTLAQRSKIGKLYALIHKDILQELVNKETPMKPNGIRCGKCGSLVGEDTRMGTIHFHRCRNIECEQKIDWGKDNE